MYYYDGVREEQLEPVTRKGPWTAEEDRLLVNYVGAHGVAITWDILARDAGLKRTGKSCRLRWLKYLSPSVRRGNITLEEHDLIVHLQAAWGNRWSRIARHLPGRTDDEIKNHWRTRIQIKKQSKQDVMAAANKSSTSAEEQGSRDSSSGRAEATHEDYGIVAPQEDTRSLNNSQGYNPHGGGGGEGSCDDAAMDVPPGILALSGENLWSFEDFWPVEMEQSFHSNSSAQFFEHEAI